MVPLTPFFHLCDLQKSRFRRNIFWTEKLKCAHTVQGTAKVPLTLFSPVRPPEIEISKKYFLDPKTKMYAYSSGNRDVTVNTFFSAVRPPEIEISKKYFWTEKRKCAHTVQKNAMVPLTPFTCATSRNLDIEEKFLDQKTKIRVYSSDVKEKIF